MHAAREDGIVALLNGAVALTLDVNDTTPVAVKDLGRKAYLVRSRSQHHGVNTRYV